MNISWLSKSSKKFGDIIAYQHDEAMDNPIRKTLRQSAHDRLLETAGFNIKASDLIRSDADPETYYIDTLYYVTAAKAVEDWNLLTGIVKDHGLHGKPENVIEVRVGIAIALINDPEIVFLDEPTAGLDPGSRRKVWDTIRELRARGKTIFLTTHHMDEAYYLADTVSILHKGRIIAEGTPEDLIDRYGGGNTLILRKCTPEALESLAKAIPHSQIEGDSVVVDLAKSDGMTNISAAAELIKSGNFSCAEICVRKPTLEDMFLGLTGEKPDAEGRSGS